MKNVINGFVFERMIKSGLNNLINNEKKINDMNVFPVPDGDTGSNMRLTLEKGISKTVKNKHLGLYLKNLSEGMLLGARGNSGVILSQIFKGFYLGLAKYGIANPGEIRDALIRAYKQAYEAVLNPVEGTILTVARLGIENIKKDIVGNINVNRVFGMYLVEMKKVIEHTPEMLEVLKKNKVLDSGAYGYICIFEGMVKSLYGEDVVLKDNKSYLVNDDDNEGDIIFFDENSKFIDGYCMEFILQLMNSKNYKTTFNIKSFQELLKQYGNSIVCFMDGTIVKVHIHTLKPSPIIMLAQNYGEFISFKLENMQLQHNEHDSFSIEKDFVIVSFVEGDGIIDLYKDLGCDVLIDLNEKDKDNIVDILRHIKAKKILVILNDERKQSLIEVVLKELEIEDITTVINSKSMVEGYYGLAMDNPSNDNLDERIDAIIDGASYVNSIVINDDNYLEEFEEKLKDIDLSDASALFAIIGKDVDNEVEKNINNLLRAYDCLEINIIRGNQTSSKLLIGII
ncbi:MAG: DAK2 domain-containing protein [Bacilli bacterium]|nr:DAK2 domain-containing protein [Bacilli bacterium]